MHESRRQQAARLRTKGHAISEIAEIMGVGEATVKHHLRLSSRRGEPVRPDPATAVLEPLPQDIQAWITQITPAGSSVSDTLRAIVTDAYHEENPPVSA